MSAAEAIDVDASVRAEAFVKRRHGKYLLKHLSFTQQFSHMYYSRLAKLTGRVRAGVEAELGAAEVKALGVSRILQLTMGTRTIIIGTLYKQLVSVTPFLREYTKELVKLVEGGGDEDEDDDEGDAGVADDDGEEGIETVVASGSAGALVSDTDSLIIEDDSGRVDIIGLPASGFVTGVVVALVGTLQDKGKFLVERSINPRPTLPPLRKLAERKEPCYIAFVSGLCVTAGGEVTAAVDMLIDFLSGHLPEPASTQAARVARLIVGGSTIETTDEARLKSKIRLEPTDHVKPTSDPSANTSANAMRKADAVLAQLAATLDVEIMAGDSDPTNCFLPQQPVHPMLLPRTARMSSVKLVTNPFEANFTASEGGRAVGPEVTVLVTAGQCVDDVTRQTDLGVTETMEAMLRWSLMAPTAPNSLPCYPFRDADPFVLEALPHAFVSCNHEQFATSLVTHPDGSSTRVLAVPAFHRTGQLVLLDIASPNLDVTTVSFL